jgi:hypothetical protein
METQLVDILMGPIPDKRMQLHWYQRRVDNGQSLGMFALRTAPGTQQTATVQWFSSERKQKQATLNMTTINVIVLFLYHTGCCRWARHLF